MPKGGGAVPYGGTMVNRAEDVMANMTVTVRISRALTVRLWLACRLAALAAWVGGAGYEADIVEKQKA